MIRGYVSNLVYKVGDLVSHLVLENIFQATMLDLYDWLLRLSLRIQGNSNQGPWKI